MSINKVSKKNYEAFIQLFIGELSNELKKACNSNVFLCQLAKNQFYQQRSKLYYSIHWTTSICYHLTLKALAFFSEKILAMPGIERRVAGLEGFPTSNVH